MMEFECVLCIVHREEPPFDSHRTKIGSCPLNSSQFDVPVATAWNVAQIQELIQICIRQLEIC